MTVPAIEIPELCHQLTVIFATFAALAAIHGLGAPLGVIVTSLAPMVTPSRLRIVTLETDANVSPGIR